MEQGMIFLIINDINMIKNILISIIISLILIFGYHSIFSSRDLSFGGTHSGFNIPSGHKLGIGTTTPQTELQTIGLMNIYPKGTGTTTCSSLIEGAMMYSTGTQGFYGCDGSNWNSF